MVNEYGTQAHVRPRRQFRPIDQMMVGDFLDGMAAGQMQPVGGGEQPLTTGFDPLDSALEGGMHLGDLTIVGGLPGVGKTIATLQWAREFARQGARVLYHCYEHDVPALFGRLLAMECGELAGRGAPEDEEKVRAAVAAVMQGDWDRDAPYAQNPIVRGALAQVERYSDHLTLSQLASATADIDMLRASVINANPAYDAVFVDYLQKVPVPGVYGVDRYATIVEGLKNVALSEHCHVVAVSAVGEGALEDHRLHIEGLRGAHVLAHEADIVLALNHKLRVVAKAHLAFDTRLHQQFARTVIFTIEKNRRGLAPLDLEFETDFRHFRFDPRGRFVAEKLVGSPGVEE